MKIHEYQAKSLYQRYGIPTPKGILALSVAEAKEAAKKLIAETGNEVVVVKAQIHAGGRGKGGGVKVVKGADAAEAFIELYGPPGTSLDGYDVDGDCSAATFAGEGSPVARGVAGASTSRDDAHSDTDDNVVDFSVGVPSPGADGPYAMATTPRLIDPLAAARVTSGDVPFRWELPAGDTGAQLELCDDAARASVITTIDATGCTWAARVASRRAWR